MYHWKTTSLSLGTGLLLGLMAGIPFCLAATVAGASEAIQLKAVTIEPVRSNPNLLPNPGFERIAANGIPTSWLWSRRNTDATCTADHSVAHRGQTSLRLTSKTPFGAHVYGSLWLNQPIRLTEGKTYTFSASVRSGVSGAVQLIGGDQWQIRASVPATGKAWRRIAKTFVAGPIDRDFTLRINVEAPTAGTWIDDVKLEEGDIPTVDSVGGDDTPVLLESDEPEAVVQSDGPFRLELTLSAPRATNATWEASIAGARPLQQPCHVAAGVWRVIVKGEQAKASDTPRRVAVRLLSYGKEIAAADVGVQFYSPSWVVDRLESLKARMPVLDKGLAAVKSLGQDVSYPRIAFTVLQNFLGYAEEDARRGEVRRATDQVCDLESMAARLDRQLKAALAGMLQLPAVPRWTGMERPVVQGCSFIGPVAFANGTTVRRPVFFTGFGHFGQVVSDMEKWPGYGTNIIQIEFGPNSVLPAEDKVSDAPMRDMLRTLDRAKKRAWPCVCLSARTTFPSGPRQNGLIFASDAKAFYNIACTRQRAKPCYGDSSLRPSCR